MPQLTGKLIFLTAAFCALLQECLSVTMDKKLTSARAYVDDKLAYRISNYFTGSNKPMNFTTDSPAVKIEPPFLIAPETHSLSKFECTKIEIARSGSYIYVYSLCDGGNWISYLTYIEDDMKANSPIGFIDLKTEVPRVCTNFKVMNNEWIVLLCHRGDEEARKHYLVGVEVRTHRKLSEFEIVPEEGEVPLISPILATDNSTTSNRIVIWDIKAKEFTSSVQFYKQDALGFKKDGYYGQTKKNIDVKLQGTSFRRVFLNDSQIFIVSQIDKQSIKPNLCKVQEGQLQCKTATSNLIDNISPENEIGLEASKTGHLIVVYGERKKFSWQLFDYNNLEDVGPQKNLFLTNNLVMEPPPIFRAVEDEMVIIGKEVGGETLMIHWNQAKKFTAVKYLVGVDIANMKSTQSPIDVNKYEVFYINKTGNRIGNVRVGDTVFDIDCSHPVFKGGQLVKIPYKVQDPDYTRNLEIEITVLQDLDFQPEIDFLNSLNVFNGHRMTLPFTSEDFKGNALTYSLESNSADFSTFVRYANSVPVKVPDYADIKDTMTRVKNIGFNYILTTTATTNRIMKCDLNFQRTLVECTKLFEVSEYEKILDAKFEEDHIFMIVVKKAEEGGDGIPRVAIAMKETDGSSGFEDAVYEIDGTTALGGIRIINNVVHADIVGKGIKEHWTTLFNIEFPEEDQPPATPGFKSALPPRINPKGIMWAPRKEPIILIESLPELGQKEVLEFEINYERAEPVHLVKLHKLNSKGETDFCVTGALIVIVEYENNKIYGIDRRYSEETIVSFPLDKINGGTVVGGSLACTRYNNAFQIISKTDEGYSLITFRSGRDILPENRVHSVRKLKSSNPKRAISSINSKAQEIFTMIFGDNLENPEGYDFEIDGPHISLMSKNQKDSETTLTITAKTHGGKVGTANGKIYSKNMDRSLSFLPLSSSSKVEFNRDSRVINFEKQIEIVGIPIRQTVEGDKASLEHVELTPRSLVSPDPYRTITESFKTIRTDGNLTFGWDSTNLMIYLDKKFVHKVQGVFIYNAEIIRNQVKIDGETINYVYLVGLSKMQLSHKELLFVVHNMSGEWKYCDYKLNDGVNFVKPKMIDPATSKFIFTASNPEQDSIEAGIFKLVKTDEPKAWKIQMDKYKPVKVLDINMYLIQSVLLADQVRVIYTQKHIGDLMTFGIDLHTLEIKGEGMVDVAALPERALMDAKLNCSELVNFNLNWTHKNFGPRDDRRNKFVCSVATPWTLSFSGLLELTGDNSYPLRVVTSSLTPNIQGYQSIAVRANEVYFASILRRISSFNTEMIPAKIRKESILIHVWKHLKNGTHALVTGSSIGITEAEGKDVKSNEIGIDFLEIGGGKTEMIISVLADKHHPKVVTLSDLKISAKDLSVDLSKIRLKIWGLEGETEMVAGDYIEFKDLSIMTKIIYIVTGSLVAMVLLATLFYCCTKESSNPNLNEKEVIGTADLTSSFSQGSSEYKQI